MVEERKKRWMTGAEVVTKYNLQPADLVNACKLGLPSANERGSKNTRQGLSMMDAGVPPYTCYSDFAVLYDGKEHLGKQILFEGPLYLSHYLMEKSIFLIKDVEAFFSDKEISLSPKREDFITGKEIMERLGWSHEELVSYWEAGFPCYKETPIGYLLHDSETWNRIETMFNCYGLHEKIFKISDIEAFLPIPEPKEKFKAKNRGGSVRNKSRHNETKKACQRILSGLGSLERMKKADFEAKTKEIYPDAVTTETRRFWRVDFPKDNKFKGSPNEK